MKAVIMAGGEGKRLRPLTCTMPKPMVPLLGKPTIDYCIEHTVKHGLTDITLTLCYMPEVLKSHLGDGRAYGASVGYCVEDAPLGTAGSVKLALSRHKDDEPVVVLSGDALCDIDLTALVRAHKNSGAAVTMALKKVRMPTEYGVVMRDEAGFVTRFLEKPLPQEVFSDLANTGIYVLSREAVDLIPAGVKYDFSGDLFPKILAQKKRIFTYVTDAYWNDIGDIREYMATQRDMLDGKCGAFSRDCACDGIIVERGALVGENAMLLSPCYIGAGAQVADGAIIGAHTVVCAGAKVETRASVKRSVLLEKAVVREGAELRGALVCENAQVGRRASLFEGAVLGANAQLGEGGTLRENACVWPGKRLSAHTAYDKNVVWDEDAGGDAYERATEGYCDTQLTPEKSVTLGAAYASVLEAPVQIAIASDGSLLGVMQKNAFAAGACSQGADVLDVGACTVSALRNAAFELALSGGVYVAGDAERARGVRFALYDETGGVISPGMERKVKKALEAGGLRPCTSARLGIVENSPIANRLYEGQLKKQYKSALAGDGTSAHSVRVVIAGSEAVFDLVSRVLLPMGISTRLIAGEDEEALMCGMSYSGASIGFLVDSAQSLARLVYGESTADRAKCTAICALAALRDGRITRAAFPSDMPREYLEYLIREGLRVDISSVRAHRRKSVKSGRYERQLCETEAMICELARLEATGRLLELYSDIPDVRSATNTVGCSWREVGRVIKSLVERERDGRVELVDGILVKCDDGWVNVRTSDDAPSFRVVAHSMNEEYAKELCDVYSKKLREALTEKDG